MDLIDRSQLDEVCSRLNADGWGITRNEYKLIDRVLFEFPSAEKTGKWIEQDDEYNDVIYQCSVCGEEFVTIEGTPADNLWNYCPNCGARMVGDNE